jgi:hypothetical protein
VGAGEVGAWLRGAHPQAAVAVLLALLQVG